MPLSDSSGTCMRAVWPEPSPAVLRLGFAAGVSEVSRFSCMKFLGVLWGLRLRRTDQRLAISPLLMLPSAHLNCVGVLIASFRSSIPSPPIPLFTLRCAPRDAQRKTRGRVDRYSFLVGILPPLLHAGLSRRTEILFALQNAPARFLQQRLMTFRGHLAGLGGADLIQRLIHLGDDVDAVEDMQRLGTFLTDHLQVGLPHIRADELDLRSELLSDDGEETLEGFDGAFLADPEQAGGPLVDLVDQGQVLVAFGVLDFVYTDGADRLQGAMLQAPADHILDGIAHFIPRSVERFGGFLPGELPRPAGQKQHIGSGQLVLAIAPGNLLDDHAAVAALDAPHAVQQEYQKAPQRDELEAPQGKMIVTRCRLVASRTDRRRARSRPDGHFDALLVGGEAGVLVDEPAMAIAVI